MIYVGILSIFFILMTAFSRHYTRALAVCLIVPVVVGLGVATFKASVWAFVLYCLVAVILFVMFLLIASKLDYDFTRRVLSIRYLLYGVLPLKMFVDKNSAQRVIGRVLPYSKYQFKYNGRYVISTETAAAGSMLISGSTGSGKTYGILSMIRQNIQDGRSVIFSEYKGDPKVIDELEAYALQHDYDVYKLVSGVSNFNYDPLRNLNNAGRVEAIMNMRKWSLDGSDAHYRTSTQLLLQKTVQDFSHRYQQAVNKVMSDGKDPKTLSYTCEYHRYMKTYQAAYGEQDAYTTVTKLLELLITSSLEPMFTFREGKTLALDQLKGKRFLLVTSFVSSNKELATSFSSLLFRDLLDEWTSSAPLHNTFLYVDEFGTLENPFIVKDILEKGRSAKIATTLSLQDINQIVIQTNEAYLNTILGTINTFVVYSGATRVTAEKFAGVQLADIEAVLMNLRKPINGKKPTAIYISKYPTLNKRITSEVFRFEPYIFDEKGAKIAKQAVKSQVNGNKVTSGKNVGQSKEHIEQSRKHEEEMERIMRGELTDEEERAYHRLRQAEIQAQEHSPQIEDVPQETRAEVSSDLEDLIFGKK